MAKLHKRGLAGVVRRRGPGLRLGDVNDGLGAKFLGRDGHLVLDELDSLFAGVAVARDDRGRMNFLPNKLVRELEQLGRNNDNRGGAIADLTAGMKRRRAGGWRR